MNESFRNLMLAGFLTGGALLGARAINAYAGGGGDCQKGCSNSLLQGILELSEKYGSLMVSRKDIGNSVQSSGSVLVKISKDGRY